jgi:hypothetical protein
MDAFVQSCELPIRPGQGMDVSGDSRLAYDIEFRKHIH